MPRVDYAFLADYVRLETGVAHVIAAGIDTVYAAEVPTGHNLALVFRLTFSRQECGRPHRVEILFEGEDGDRLAHLSSIVTPERTEDLPVHWRQGYLSGLNFGVPLPQYGVYDFVIMVNDEERGRVVLRVVPREQPQDVADELEEEPPGDGEQPGPADAE